MVLPPTSVPMLVRAEMELPAASDGHAEFSFHAGDLIPGDQEGTLGLPQLEALIFTRRLAIELVLVDADADIEWRWLRARPFARISLHPGDVSGYARPIDKIELRLLDEASSELASGLAYSDEKGQFSAWLHAPDGQRVRPAPGHQLEIRDSDLVRRIKIGDFDAQWDLESNRLEGRTEPDTELGFSLWNPWRPGEVETPTTRASSDGTWDLSPEYGLHPTTHFYITVMQAAGDDLFYCQQIPMIYAEEGSPEVEIQSLWDGQSELLLERDGAIVAEAIGGAVWSGSPTLVLRDEAGETMPLEAGDVLRLMSHGQELAFEIEALRAEIDLEKRLVTGRSPAGRDLLLAYPEAPIQDSLTRSAGEGSFEIDAAAWIGTEEESDGEEASSTEADSEDSGLAGLAYEERIDLIMPHPDGHQMRRRFYGPLLELDLNKAEYVLTKDSTLQASGSAGPSLQLDLLDDAGADLEAEADRLLAARAHLDSSALESPDPALAHQERGMIDSSDLAGLLAGKLRIEVGSNAQNILDMVPPRLDLDLSEYPERLYGTGPADELLFLSFYLADGEPAYNAAADVGEDGRWQLDLDSRAKPGLPAIPHEKVQRIEVLWKADGLRLTRSWKVPSP